MGGLLRSFAILVILLPAWGAEPSQLAAALQRQSVQAMQASLARQRASVARMRLALLRQREAAPRVALPAAMAWPAPAPASASPPPCQALADTEVNALASQAGQSEGLAAELLRAVMRQESSFYPCAVSRRGAMGLMQLMPTTAAQFGVQDPFDPKENVGAGARFLKQLLARYGGDLALALGAYNAGPAKVDEAGGVPPLAETQDYVRKILGQGFE
jgi:soluble lytic murein transglycosylase-like protein